MFKWLFGTKQTRCAAKGHRNATENSRRELPDHPKNDADFKVVEIAYECPDCNTIFSLTRLSFRKGARGFLTENHN